MRQKIFLVFMFFTLMMNAQKLSFSGMIYSAKTHEPIAGALIHNLTDGSTTESNNFGAFSLIVEKNAENKIIITYIGYDTIFYKFKIVKNVEKNFFLRGNIKIQAVQIIGQKKSQIGIFSISQKEIKILPSLTGDFDILKSFQYMPGIGFGPEGKTNLYILGGNPDQNLMTIDGLPVFFVSHYGNFVSIFDIEAIRKAQLIKSGFSPEYGGRLSGYLNLFLKDGDMKKRSMIINIGILSSKISSNGFIVKNKLSYLITLRRSNLDWLTQLYSLLSKSKNISGYNFFDANLKLNYILNSNNKLQLIAYAGQDRSYEKMENSRFLSSDNQIALPGETVQKTPYTKSKDIYQWGNQAIAVKWIFHKNRIFGNSMLGCTKYQYANNRDAIKFDADNNFLKHNILKNNDFIQYYFAKSNWNFNISNSLIFKIGQEFDYYTTEPISFQSKNLDSLNNLISSFNKKEPLYSQYLFSPYFDFDYNFHQKLYLKAGIRLNFYSKKIYYSPRIRLSYSPYKKLVFAFSYTKTFQFVHLLSTSTSISSQDLWILSKNKALPENSNLFDFNSIFFISKNTKLTLGVFYKNFRNILDYKRLIFDANLSIWDRIEYNGKGNAYGTYFLLNYTMRKLNFCLSYTYLKNYRQFQNLNNAKPFPDYYSRKHNFNFVLTYKFSQHWNVSAVFVFTSGMPYTIPVFSRNTVIPNSYILNIQTPDSNFYKYSENYYYKYEIFSYNKINNYTLPPYHRLDLAVKYMWKAKRKKIDYALSLNIYNVYNHMNPYVVYGYYDPKKNIIKYKKYTMFPIIPSVAYTIKF